MVNRIGRSALPIRRSRPRSASGRTAIAGLSLALALALAACSGGSSNGGSSGSGSTGGGSTGGGGASSSGNPSSGATASAGGVVTFAESANYAPTWILPFYSGEFFTIQEQGWFENLMWPPLFNQSNGASPAVDYAASIGNRPVYSSNGKVVTLTLKHWKWSDGQAVTARDLTFWMNLLKANKAQWADYTPGQFPDNVKSIQAINPYKIQMKLDKAYGADYFNGNELSQITPIPQHVWDKTSATGKVGNFDETPAGARAVMSFLMAQSKDLKTYATNPLWQTVYGPWKLSGYTLSGKVTFVPNKLYSGPHKPKISQFIELPFTSKDAEYNALRAGDLTVGSIPANDYSTIPAIKALGYNVSPWKLYGFNSLFINFNNPAAGPAFRQLYLRQALQYLVDQNLQISKIYSGFGQPDYGMVVNGPPALNSKVDPYPYDPAKASALLSAHGWSVHPGGTTTCAHPGTGAAECGAGIKAGLPLKFDLLIYSGSSAQSAAMTSYKTTAATAGIVLDLVTNVNVFAASPACKSTQSSCSWQIADWGGGVYTPPNGYPVGAGYLVCNGNNNHQNYCDPKQDKLIDAAVSASATQADYSAWEKYSSQQLPMLWQPLGDFQVIAAKKSLVGPTPGNATLSIFPESWYFTK